MTSTTLQGPAGGEWVRVNGAGRDVPNRCDLCGALVSESYRYYVGLVSHASVCLTCADITPNAEEATTMEGIAGITPEILAEVALSLEAAHLDWEEGRAASPDSADYVRIAEQVVAERIGPEYLWLTDGVEGFGLVNAESVAEALYEAQQDGTTLQEWPEVAEWLCGMVTVGPDAPDYPHGERS